MVITTMIAQYQVGKVLVDQGSSANILYWKTFQQMEVSEEQIIGFAGERVDTKGYVDLRVSLGVERGAKELKVRFLLVEVDTSYNVLLGRPCLNAFGVIVSTPHLTMKYPSDDGRVCTVRAYQKMARECYVAGLKVKPRLSGVVGDGWSVVAMAELDPRASTEDQMEPMGEVRPFSLGEKEDQVTTMGRSLKDEQVGVGRVLIQNRDLFAWTAADMPSIHPVSLLINYLCLKMPDQFLKRRED